VLLILPHVPGLSGDFGRSLLTQMSIAAVFALSYNLLLGQTGLLSFGHAAYFGLGGYAGIHLLRAINAGLPVPVPLVPAVGAIAGLVFGMLFGSVTARRGGVVFALISLGIGELVFAALRMLQGFSGGEEGITANRGAGPHILGFSFATQIQIYYIVAFWAFLSAALMHAFLRTPVGRMCNAVRDNPERVEFIGYDPVRVRFVVLSIAAMFAGLAGGLHAINYEIVAPEAAGAGRSATVLLMVYIGGVAEFIGPVLGAVIVTWLQASLSDYTSAWRLYLGLFFMAIVLYAPRGLAGIVLMHLPVIGARALYGVMKSYALALVPTLAAIAGGIILLEMNYRLSTQPEAGTRLRLFWIEVNASTPWPWLIGFILLAAGLYWLHKASRSIGAAWERARSEVSARRAGER